MSNLISTNGTLYGFNPLSNTFQQPLLKWKGRTFNQIFASIQKNKISMKTIQPNDLLRPLPQKLYRKEFASTSFSTTSSSQNQRWAVKIDNLTSPNGYFISSQSTPNGVLTTTMDIQYENNKTQHPKTCSSFSSTTGVCLTPDMNAKRRVRSAGMIRKKFNPFRNNDSIYHTSATEYLVNRSLTFQQNQYNYLRNGTNQYKPGQKQTINNDYSAQGIQHCFYSGDISTTSIANLPHKKVVYKPNNAKFSQQGAVSASSLLNRKKVDRFETNANLTVSSFGNATGNSMKYRFGATTNDNIYNLKIRKGFPTKCTPKITTTGKYITCNLPNATNIHLDSL